MKSFALSLLLLSLGLFCLGCQQDPAKQSVSETKPATGAPGERAGEIPATVPQTEEKKADEGPATVDGRPEVERLIANLKDNDWLVRREAAEALGKLGDKRAVTPLIACLTDADSSVRFNVVEALGKLGDKQAVEPLIACLKDEDERIRRAAAEALGKLGDKRAVEPLIAALPDWPIKDTIGTALKQLDGKPATDKQRFYCRVAARDNKGLLEDWKQTRQLILDDAGSQDPRKVQNAIYTVIALGKEEMVDDLARLLNSREEKDIAEVYLNCRHKGLSKAAGDWAARRGYITPGGAGGSGPDWGRW